MEINKNSVRKQRGWQKIVAASFFRIFREIYLSANLESCLYFYEEPENEKSFPALLQFPMRMGRMLNEGFKAALKANGIKVEEFRIEEKLS
ncbi:MAG TPA: hypothetical protein ENN90_08265 [Mariniphaga anaerophila]|uniref:Uncharacterized protein n=1 Tax=Mariniphaga anaerophila TaxID=1484053 RepID=A0A831LL86_9BACT|nr:hypothetical protein [Mariniphaga anaerophila]